MKSTKNHFHNGTAPALEAVVQTYNTKMALGLTATQMANLTQYLKSLEAWGRIGRRKAGHRWKSGMQRKLAANFPNRVGSPPSGIGRPSWRGQCPHPDANPGGKVFVQDTG